jgi:hypothetical protein
VFGFAVLCAVHLLMCASLVAIANPIAAGVAKAARMLR